MFISLKRLSQENTVAGELASFLLGKTIVIKNEDVKRIFETLKKSCEEFCDDKGVKKSMSVAEELRMEGRIEGRAEGRTEGKVEGKFETIRELAELFNSGMSFEEALQKLNEEAAALTRG